MYLFILRNLRLNILTRINNRQRGAITPSRHKGGHAMISTLNKNNLYRWILALTVSGVFVLLLSGGEGLHERFTFSSFVDAETDWTLANGRVAEEVEVDWTLASKEDVQEEKVDWTLANKDSQDTNEHEPDWTLARNDGHLQEEPDWTLA